jgi:predicted GTPase
MAKQPKKVVSTALTIPTTGITKTTIASAASLMIAEKDPRERLILAKVLSTAAENIKSTVDMDEMEYGLIDGIDVRKSQKKAYVLNEETPETLALKAEIVAAEEEVTAAKARVSSRQARLDALVASEVLNKRNGYEKIQEIASVIIQG